MHLKKKNKKSCKLIAPDYCVGQVCTTEKQVTNVKETGLFRVNPRKGKHIGNMQFLRLKPYYKIQEALNEKYIL